MRTYRQIIFPLPDDDFAKRIDDLAERIERLIVSRHKPEFFFEEKSEIAEGLRRIAAEVLNG